MTTKEGGPLDKTKENADLWVQFASAALNAFARDLPLEAARDEDIAQAAGELADTMLAEWHKRFGIEKDIGSPLR